MKKLFTLCMFITCSLLTFAMDGSGTSSDPYQVKTADDLYMVRSSLSSYYKLMNDIDLSQWIADNYPEAGWAPIGSTASPFTGTFDGDNHTISNLNINRTTDYNGLFGYADGATIKNVNIQCDITGGNYTAAIIGDGSKISAYNCIVKGNITGGSYTGGLMGFGVTLSIYKCAIEGDIIGKGYTGGLIGEIGQNTSGDNSGSVVYRSSIYQCYCKGNIESSGTYTGGMFGYDASAYYYYSGHSYYNSSNIHDLYFDGTITSSSVVS